MPRRLRYTEDAIDDLDQIRDWLTQPGPGASARRRLASIKGSIGRLRHHPCLYPVDQHPGVRELPCEGGYRALYRVHPDTGRNETAGDVRVIRVFGPGQDRSDL